jgi:phosphoribosylglycinamide formyltransferase 1
MKKIIFLGSGGGGNMKFVHSYSQKHNNYFNVVSVITDRKCGASEYAFCKGIPCEIMSFKRTIKEDKLLMNSLKDFSPDYIITNVHKILSKRIVSEFRGKLLNLHYSYLPAFGGHIGMHPVVQAIEKNNPFIGCTMHFVDEKVDAGNTIAQGIIIYKESKNIYQSVFECGAITLLSGLFKISGFEDINFKNIKEYIVSPFSTKLDINLSHKILLNLQKEQ